MKDKIHWYGCYSGSWQSGPLVPEAYSHPAKVAYGLAARIYQHAIERGYLSAGSEVVDPFGGIAGFALHAITNGINWTGCELEPKFCELGNQNIALWNERYGRYFADLGKPFGVARLIQGDSRKLAEIVQSAAVCVSSPPYSDALNTRNHGIVDERRKRNQDDIQQAYYGRSPGQLGAMPEGSFDAAVSSPPYSDAINGSGEGPGARFDSTHHSPDNANKRSSGNEYGRTPGNLGNMSGYDGVVSSPPFEKVVTHDGGPAWQQGGKLHSDYGDTPGNIGNDQGSTFWAASRVILEQVYSVLRPGGVAMFVTGDFQRNGLRVCFGQQWLDLCTAVGFVFEDWIVAHKQESKGVQLDIFGNEVKQTVDRVSFFRRLSNAKNPESAILNEDVIIVKRPG